MRDANIKLHDNNKLDNSVDPLSEIQKLNMAEFKNTVKLSVDEFKNDKVDPVKEIQKFNMVDNFKKVKQNNEANMRNYNKNEVIQNDIKNDVPINDAALKSGDGKEVDLCDCQHGGGCVNHGCICPLGYAGDKCEITLDLKVRSLT